MTLTPIAAIVLAAGQSRRYGDANKLLSHFAGKPLLHHALEPLVKSDVHDIVVVTGHEATCVHGALKDYPVRTIENVHFNEGVASSIRTGLTTLAPDASAVFVVLGDMPNVSGATYDAILQAWQDDQEVHAIVPTYGGRRGNPVLFGKSAIPDLVRLEGDRGARDLLRQTAWRIKEVEVADDGIHFDVDTAT